MSHIKDLEKTKEARKADLDLYCIIVVQYSGTIAVCPSL
jgi:hypothetical protein